MGTGADINGWTFSNRTLYDHLRTVVFSPDSKSVFVFARFPDPDNKADADQFVQIDLKRGERWFSGTAIATTGICTLNGRNLVTWNGGPEIAIWDIADKKQDKVVKVSPQKLYDVVLSPNGNTLATAGDDGVVKFWSTTAWTQLEPEKQYRHSEVDLIRFSPDGKYLITGSDSGLIKVWDGPEFGWSSTE